MAEAVFRALAPGVPVARAGWRPTRLSPHAEAVLAEVGIAIGGQRSKAIGEVSLTGIGTVVTLCAEEVCPFLPGDVVRLHWPLADPAAAGGSEAEVRAAFRSVRDEIRARILELLGSGAGRPTPFTPSGP